MHYNWQPLFISFLIPSLFGNEQLVSGARIPPSVRRDISPETVDVSGLNVFREYICPNAANVRRQIPGTVAVPKDQLNTVLQQLQDMELTVLALINQYLIDGQLDSTDPSGVFVGSNGRVISISSPEPSSVDLDAPSSAVGSVLLAEPTAAAATFGNAAAPSTTTPESDSAAAPSAFLADAAASGTTTPDSESAVSSASPTEPATPTLSNGGIFAQKSATSETAPTSDAGPSEDSTTGYIFNAGSSKNVAVYFGQTPVTGGTTLAAQCADPNVDIVILAFVISTSYRGSYPQLNFGAACGGQTPEMVSEAPGLLSCPTLATDITTCQTTYGKKVFLSIGGADSQISFPTTASASTFATTMWNLFGPPGNADIGLRPFGTVQIDGFDVDNEDNLPANWATFATTLRTYYASTKTKTYYLSSAPQCPFPDASNPQALLLLCDFVWVQFYNNPQCQIGSVGFTASLEQWSGALLKSTMATKPRLYLGAPAYSAAGSTAYTAIGNAQGMKAIASSVENMGLSNFGGVMFWDGPEAMLNTAGGKDILGWAKAGLTA